MRTGDGAGELRRGWPVVLSAMLGILVTNIHTYSLGMFIRPLEQAFGWSRADITAASGVTAVMGLVLYPLVGATIDRVGARKVALPGVALYALGLACLGLTGPSIWSWWAAFVFLAFGHMMASVSVWTSGVAGRFDRRRGLALGIATAGGGVCSAIMPSLANLLVEHLGWRQAYFALAGLSLVVALPTAVLFFWDARNLRAREQQTRKGTAPAWAPPGLTVLQGMRTFTFWRLAVATLCLTTGILAMTVHFPQILVEDGLSRTAAAAIVGLVGAASIAGRLGTGFLLDRFHARIIGGLLYVLPAVSCVLLLQGGPLEVIAPLAALSLGLALGAEVDVLSYCAARFFGLKSYGVLFGVFAALMTAGAGLGPLLGGLIHDATGGYQLMLAGAAGLFLVAGALVVTLGAYPPIGSTVPEREEAAAP